MSKTSHLCLGQSYLSVYIQFIFSTCVFFARSAIAEKLLEPITIKHITLLRVDLTWSEAHGNELNFSP